MKLPLLFSLPLLLLASCSSSKKNETKAKEEDKPRKTQKQIIGRIASVSRARDFVLIQKFGPGLLPEGLIYQSQGPAGRSASLKPSGERVRDFYAADLLSGEVTKGDAVIAYPESITKDEPSIPSEVSEPAESNTPSSPSNETTP